MTARSTVCSASRCSKSHLRSLLPSSELQNDGSGSYLFALADRTLGGSDFPVSIITDSAGENAALEEAGDTSCSPSIHGGYRAMIDGEYCHEVLSHE